MPWRHRRTDTLRSTHSRVGIRCGRAARKPSRYQQNHQIRELRAGNVQQQSRRMYRHCQRMLPARAGHYHPWILRHPRNAARRSLFSYWHQRQLSRTAHHQHRRTSGLQNPRGTLLPRTSCQTDYRSCRICGAEKQLQPRLRRM